MKQTRFFAGLSFFLAGCLGSNALADTVPDRAETEMIETEVIYELDGTEFESTIVHGIEGDEPLPGILMVPNWMGPTEASLEKAKAVAEEGRVVMMVDMYGVDVRPADSGEAAEAAGSVRADRSLMRARLGKAHDVLRQKEGIPLDPERLAAIGFCFGGGTVLEYARSGADLDAVVSFHGDLASPTLETDSGQIQSAVLVLHGADDPYVPQEDVTAFREAMLATEADWTLVQFGNAVHSFTDPEANAPGEAMYDSLVAERAFSFMEELFEALWKD
ncbi:MAG: dienelactone hydrolase family protein [Oceanipulchritudo sp.]